MAFTVIASVAAGSADKNTVTTAGIDTTGADLLILVRSDFGASRAAVSDSKGNSWNALTVSQAAGSGGATTIFWSKPVAVGAAHTFTATQANSFPTLNVLAVSGGAALAPADQENGAAFAAATTAQAGSITPTENNEIVIAAITHDTAVASLAIGSSYNLSTSVVTNTNHEGGGLAYIIQTSAAATNPQWSWNTASNGSARIASFKALPSVGITSSSGNSSMAGDYLHYQNQYTKKVADVDILTGTANYADVLTPKSANHQLFVQRITLSITSHVAADVYTFDDDGAGPAIAVHTDAAAAAGVPSVVTWDFGPIGRPITKGANVDVSHSSTGVAVAHIEGYERLIGPVAPATTN